MKLTLAVAGILAVAGGSRALTLESGPARMTLDPDTGAIVSVAEADRDGAILRGGEDGAWSLAFRDGSTLAASSFHATNASRRVAVRPGADGRSADLAFESAEARVTVFVRPSDSGFDLTAAVAPGTGTVLELALPGRLRFAPADVKRFVAPLDPHKGVGVAFNGGFFARQPADRPAAWAPEPSPGRGITMILPSGPRMLPLDAPPVALRATPEGVRILGTNLAARFGRARAEVHRPPPPGQAPAVLVDSDAGPLLCAHPVGDGFLWRLTGRLEERDAGLVRDAVTRILRDASASTPGRRRIALVSVRNGPEAGAFTSLSVAQWRETLERAAREMNCGFAELPTAQAITDAVRGQGDLAIVNPYGEWLPVAADDTLTNAVAAVARHVRAGGRWFETGGYPFHAALRPSEFLRCESTYPPVFADFVHLESAAGRAAVHRVQPRTWAPWAGAGNPAAILIPGRLGFGGDGGGGRLDRSFAAFVPPGVAWTSPVVRIAVGGSAEAGLAAYAAANGIDRPLRAKMKPDVLDRLRRAVLLKIHGGARDIAAALPRLPSPAILHSSGYLKGGFDKEYPDHLPPNAGFGTQEEMRELHAKARAAGHLVMPYTNPTWWCDHPRGPTFLAAGEAPLSVGPDGKPYRERYSDNDGWTTCFWHPAVRSANRELRRQFLEDVPVDILFQDQVGARPWRWDFNPAAPRPHAYAEGLLSQADEDAALAPLGTEDGWDRAAQVESMLCGFTFTLVPGRRPAWAQPFRITYPPDTWELWPLAQRLAHDKCAFYHHDLGKFVVTPSDMAWTLGLGFNMSYSMAAGAASDAQVMGWLAWLDRIQKSVCARYTGEPVAAFTHTRAGANAEHRTLNIEHRSADSTANSQQPPTNTQSSSTLAPRPPPLPDDGLIRAQYGSVKIVANLGPDPREVDGRTLPGFGFRAAAPGMTAGVLQPPPGAAATNPAAFVVEVSSGRADAWFFGSPGADAAADLPAGFVPAAVIFDGREPVPASPGDGTLRLTLPPAPGATPRLWHATLVPAPG
ncbi:MAG: hypothetical protein FJ221_08705 [Lentisphaerae bacterium]|nr:hypothetical protein [Lentisphaerota bacterium]